MTEPYQLTESTRAFIAQHEHDDVRTLALAAARYKDVDMNMAIQQIAGRQMARVKLPSWHALDALWYPVHLSLEQCSSEATAQYKANLVGGNRMTDLTGGLGVDFSFMAKHFKEAHYVEHDEALCQLATHNFPLLGLPHAHIHHEDCHTYLLHMNATDLIYLDPARRNAHGGKVVRISECEPNIASLQAHLLDKADMVMVKLSPMLDLTEAMRQVGCLHDLHVVAVGNECKEIVMTLRKENVDEPSIHCANVTPQGTQRLDFRLSEEKDASCPIATQIGRYLYEPHAAIMKGGAYKLTGTRYHLEKLHPNTHLYTSDQWVPDFPGRRFVVEDVGGFGKHDLRTLLDGLKQANLSVRNFPQSVATLRKQLKLREGGDTYLFATTIGTNKVLVRAKAAPASM